MKNGTSRPVGRFAGFTLGGAAIVVTFFFGTLCVLNFLYPEFPRNFDIRSLPRQTGSLEVNGSAKAIQGTNPAGFLSYGPYVDLEPGNYTAVVAVICNAANNNLVDVVSNVGKINLGKKNFACGSAREELRIPFELTQRATGLEIRVFFGGNGAMQLMSLRLERN